MGKRPNKAQSLTKEEEEILWKNGQLGDETPPSLINTVWWFLTMYFGLRSRQEHHDMKVEDFPFQRDVGVEFVTFSEGLTKTRGGKRWWSASLTSAEQLLKCLRPARRDAPLLC